MARKLFGTDGVRGRANVEPITPSTVLSLAMAAGQRFRRGNHRHLVVIGKDTRLSGYMLEPALTAGFISMGMDVDLVGPMPTPAVAMLTRSLRADLGVVISASHNLYQDNGIKLFGPDGYKLSDDEEGEIVALMDAGPDESELASSDALGRAKRLEDAPGRYIEFIKQTFPRGLRLDGLNGAHIGIALDGDADRMIIADESGRVLDGDQIMALIATSWQGRDRLQGGGVVATVMSNLGLERYLSGIGLSLARTAVGDRYVVEHMRSQNFNVGGEQSGHIILSDYGTTGDGLVAALQVLAVVVAEGRKVSDVCSLFEPVPQLLRNVRFNGGQPLEDSRVIDAIRTGEAALGKGGRLVIRKSGTEPVIRVMAEGDDDTLVTRVVGDIVGVIEEAGHA